MVKVLKVKIILFFKKYINIIAEPRAIIRCAITSAVNTGGKPGRTNSERLWAHTQHFTKHHDMIKCDYDSIKDTQTNIHFIYIDIYLLIS